VSESAADPTRTGQEPSETDAESGSGPVGTPDAASDDRSDADEVAASTDDSPDTARESPSSLTFRITPVTLLVVILIAVCITPVAWVTPWTLSIYLVPLLLAVWVLRSRTVVDTDRITARTMLHTTRIPWDQVQSFRLNERRWLRAVLASDDVDSASTSDKRAREVLLPAVRVRDLPHLAALSGGRLSAPDVTRSAPQQEQGDSPADETSTADETGTADEAEAAAPDDGDTAR
jgi:hypothetical protein